MIEDIGQQPFDGARIDANAPVEAHHEIEQLDVTGIDHPIDAGRRKLLPECRHDRNPMHDIAERTEAND